MSLSVNCLFVCRLGLREYVFMTVNCVCLSVGVDGLCVSMTVNCLFVCRLGS